MSTPTLLINSSEIRELVNPALDPARVDHVERFDLPPELADASLPLRISADVRSTGVTGTPGQDCMIFFNVALDSGPVFWDTFLYPDSGTTPWRNLATEIRPRGQFKSIELHIRFHAKGKLELRNLRIETIEPIPADADCTIAVFGDSTDMTCYLPTEHRLPRKLELLLRDRFADHRIDVHNLAEGGETALRVVDSGRLDRELLALQHCDIATVRYGLNDASKNVTPDEFAKQLHAICDTITRRHPRAKIVLSTTIPPLGEPYEAPTLAVAAARKLPCLRLDDFLRQRSAAGDWNWHHDPGHRFGRRRDTLPPNNPTGLTGDLHPNAHGAQMIAEFYFDHLETLVAEVLGGTRHEWRAK